MAFERYENVPVYMSHPSVSSGAQIFALTKDFTISVSDSLIESRITGRRAMDSDFVPSGQKAGNISMNVYMDGSTGFESFICKSIFFENGLSMKVGSTIFKECYLDSVSFNVAPFSPVMLSLNFLCYDFPSQRIITASPVSGNILDLANGASSSVVVQNGEFQGIMDASFSIKATREAMFSPGLLIPYRVNLKEAVMDTRIRSGGLSDFVDYKGREMSFYFTVASSSKSCLTSEMINTARSRPEFQTIIRGMCHEQDCSLEEGGFMNYSAAISTILY